MHILASQSYLFSGLFSLWPISSVFVLMPLLCCILGGKYLVFVSSRSVKMRGSSAFSVCRFLRKVDYVKQNIIVHFIIQKLKNKYTFLKNIPTEKAEEPLILTEREKTKTRYFPPKWVIQVILVLRNLLSHAISLSSLKTPMSGLP